MLTLLVLSLAAAGCGSSKKHAASAPAVSKPAFLAKGNAVCAKGDQELGAAGRAFRGRPTRTQFIRYVSQSFAPIVQRQIDAIGALGAPAGDQATVTKILDTAQTDLDSVKKNPGLLGGRRDPFADFKRLAHPYGLTACAAR
jgi:hypothetical protein